METVANIGDTVTTLWAKFLNLIGCIVICHNPEAPEELFK